MDSASKSFPKPMAMSKSPGLSAVEGDSADWAREQTQLAGFDFLPDDLTSVPKTHTTKPGVMTHASL